MHRALCTAMSGKGREGTLVGADCSTQPMDRFCVRGGGGCASCAHVPLLKLVTGMRGGVAFRGPWPCQSSIAGGDSHGWVTAPPPPPCSDDSQQPPGVVQNWSTLQCSKQNTEQCGYDHAPVTRGRMRAQFPLPHGPCSDRGLVGNVVTAGLFYDGWGVDAHFVTSSPAHRRRWTIRAPGKARIPASHGQEMLWTLRYG